MWSFLKKKIDIVCNKLLPSYLGGVTAGRGGRVKLLTEGLTRGRNERLKQLIERARIIKL